MKKKLVWIAVGIVVIGALILSPIPATWGRPSKRAMETYNACEMITIGHRIRWLNDETGRVAWEHEASSALKREIAGMEEVLDGNSSVPIVVYENPKGALRIVVTMTKADSYGMVWGVTETGCVVKYDPRDIAEHK